MKITRNKQNLEITEEEWINSSYSLKGWTEGEYIEIINKINIPLSITMRQARLILLKYNLLELVNNAISTMNETARITWEYSFLVERNSHLFSGITTTLGFTEEQVNNMFIEASKL